MKIISILNLHFQNKLLMNPTIAIILNHRIILIINNKTAIHSCHFAIVLQIALQNNWIIILFSPRIRIIRLE